MIFGDTDILLHHEDNIVLTDTFDFSQSIFDLEEPTFASLSDDFVTPSSFINHKFEGFENLLKIGHINSCSIPKHLHEISKIAWSTKLDILGSCETFITGDTPKSTFEINGYNFFMLTEYTNRVVVLAAMFQVILLLNKLNYLRNWFNLKCF